MTDSERRPLTPLALRDYLQDAFLRYYDTAYEVRDPAVAAERRRLLVSEAAAFAEPYLEVLPRYPSSTTSLADVLADLGVPEASSLIAAGLLTFPTAYVHQEQVLRSSMAGRDVVVTSGTGSGKTEAFLLPVITRLVRESAGWSRPDPEPNKWWTASGSPFRAQRPQNAGRLPGVRALVLYPMNALVEDQLVRLRKALDSAESDRWFEQHRPGHRFYFGRYTGRTPVPGALADADDSARVNRLRAIMRDADGRRQSLESQLAAPNDLPEGTEFFMPRLHGAEMRSRWDMQAAAPDILITNYSMLSIALGRSDEKPLLDQTAQWLAADREKHVFTLVVDELHMYRGTAGTEVAYLLRRLIHRLGLDRNPEQLSVVATSASLEGDEVGRRFVEEFLGRNRDLRIIGTSPIRPDGAPDLLALTAPSAPADQQSGQIARDIESAFYDATLRAGRPRATKAAIVAASLFPGAPDADERLERLVELLGSSPDPVVRLRVHLFFRTLQGIWACAEPECTEVDPQYRHADRRIGRLYARPLFSCPCGGRVLELLYCQSCGEIMLGGYVARSGPREFLVSTAANLDRLPERSLNERTAQGYRVYWPTARTPVVRPWKRKGGAPGDPERVDYSFAFKRVALRPALGLLDRQARNGATGYVYTVSGRTGADDPQALPPYPTQCPACGDDWERMSAGSVEDPDRTRSPIYTQGVGFNRANQVLTGALHRHLNTNLVVFSDSRQGAARVTANLELAHYLDLVRAAAFRELSQATDNFELAVANVQGLDASPAAAEALARVRTANPNAALALFLRAQGAALSPADEAALDAARRAFSGHPSLHDLALQVEAALLAIGVSPAGPAQSTLTSKDDHSWVKLYDWAADPVRDFGIALTRHQQEQLADMRHHLSRQIVRTLFAGGDRDSEAIGVAYATVAGDPAAHAPAGMGEDRFRQAVSSFLRLVSRRHRMTALLDAQLSWPPEARRYIEAVAESVGGLSPDELLQAVERCVEGGPGTGFRLRHEKVHLRRGEGLQWRCPLCRAKHLHPSAGVCISCSGALPVDGTEFRVEDDYYGWLSSNEGGIYRLHCEELSGQTDPLQAQKRQAQFQDVFLDEEEQPLADGIDVLSVTTTMEAGVDIGALKAVVMANMPPQRFNYQQRVGRAGRRSEHLAAALTVCRGGRSHDEHYFANPDRITGDDPPPPYLDTDSLDILRRAFAAEVLGHAFRRAASTLSDFDPGRNVHGQMGQVEDWLTHPALSRTIRTILIEDSDALHDAAIALLASTKASLRTTPDSLVQWAQDMLPGLISTVANSARVESLSEALAQGGVLPMFGFPTQVRLLWTNRPGRGREPDTVDRDADIALSEFAPGAEIVKDKAIHSIVGIAHFLQAKDGHWREVDDPLGARARAGVCSGCLTIHEDGSSDHCPVCGALEPTYLTYDLAEPAGYRTSFRRRDYEQLLERTPGAGQARLTLPPETSTTHGELTARSGNAEVVAVNDNNGDLYQFVRANRRWKDEIRSEAGYVESRFVDSRSDRDRARTVGWEAAGAALEPVALAARRRTDVLTLGLTREPTGLRIDPASPAGRAAWGSLGFLVRAVAADLLDVGPDELEVGVTSVHADGRAHGLLFLADSLENGAGYSRWLYSHLERVMQAAEQRADALPAHATTEGQPCDSSCYQCLRDYWNSGWHPLLDWRMARDLLHLLRGRPLDTSLAWSGLEGVASAVARDFSLDVGSVGAIPTLTSPRSGRSVAFAHPFQDRTSESAADELNGLVADPAITVSTWFDLVRRPGLVVGRLMGA